MPKKTPTLLSRPTPTGNKKSARGSAANSTRACSLPLEPEPPEHSKAAVLPRDLLQRFHVAEVAESFGVRPRTVRSWIEKGLLEREKVGNSVFIRADQIETMLSHSSKKKTGSAAHSAGCSDAS